MNLLLHRIGAIAAWIAAAAFLVSGAFEIFKAVRTTSWVPAPGRILDATIEKKQGRRRVEHSVKIEYEFEVGEETFTGRDVRVRLIENKSRDHAEEVLARYPVGREVVVHHDPADPRASVLEPGVTGWNFVLFGSGLVFVVAAVFARRRLRAMVAQHEAIDAEARDEPAEPLLEPDEYAAIVREAEAHSLRDPDGYRRSIARMAVAGYAYVWLLLITAIAAVAVLVWLGSSQGGRLLARKLALPIVLFAGALVRGLFVRHAPPDGLKLRRSDFPQLFARVDEMGRALRTPRIHEIRVDEDFNAGVAAVPRLGLLGFPKHVLQLGMPMLLALPLDRFEAVLAHELGHISARHSRVQRWIYTVRVVWIRLVHAMKKEAGWAHFLVLPFFRWFAPRFAARSLVLARQHEYEADAWSTTFVGPRVAGDALIETALRSDEDSDLDDGQRLAEALADEGSLFDTHPTLRERLVALGVEPRIPPRASRNAAQELFGGALPGVLADLEERSKAEAEAETVAA